jgi:membrane protein required for colicin V production
MTSLDILVVLLMGGAGLLGFARGFVTEALSLAAWVFAIAAVRLFHAPVASALEKTVGTASGASTLAAALVFGLAMFGGRMIARRIGSQTRNSFVGSFDRVLGFGFGAVKGLVLASVVFLFFSLGYNVIYGAAATRPQWMEQSHTYPLLNASSRALVDFVKERQKIKPDVKADAPSGIDR